MKKKFEKYLLSKQNIHKQHIVTTSMIEAFENTRILRNENICKHNIIKMLLGKIIKRLKINCKKQ